MSDDTLFSMNAANLSGSVSLSKWDDLLRISCDDGDSGGCNLTRAEVIALRDKLSEWIGDEPSVSFAAFVKARTEFTERWPFGSSGPDRDAAWRSFVERWADFIAPAYVESFLRRKK